MDLDRVLLVGDLGWNCERFWLLRDMGIKLAGIWVEGDDCWAWTAGPQESLSGCIINLGSDVDTDEVLAQRIREFSPEVILFQYMAYWTLADKTCMIMNRIMNLNDANLLGRKVLCVRHQGACLWQSEAISSGRLAIEFARLDGCLFPTLHLENKYSRSMGIRGIVPTEVADGDGPLAEFMTENFEDKLSAKTGEPHIACIGRPNDLDIDAAVANKIHVHVYFNNFDSLPVAFIQCRSNYLHIHKTMQTQGKGCVLDKKAVWEIKSKWTEEFSRYDAGWSYQHICPNRHGTYAVGGLPVIYPEICPNTEDENKQLCSAGINIPFSEENSWQRLKECLMDRTYMQDKTEKARQYETRYQFSFDYNVPVLFGFLKKLKKQSSL